MKTVSPYKQIRLSECLLQKEMAEFLGIGEHRYKLYELGYVRMPYELQLKILKIDDTGKYNQVINFIENLIEIENNKRKITK